MKLIFFYISVVEALIARGVHPDRMVSEGLGCSQPLPDGHESKRVEIKVVGLPENIQHNHERQKETLQSFNVPFSNVSLPCPLLLQST